MQVANRIDCLLLGPACSNVGSQHHLGSPALLTRPRTCLGVAGSHGVASSPGWQRSSNLSKILRVPPHCGRRFFTSRCGHWDRIRKIRSILKLSYAIYKKTCRRSTRTWTWSCMSRGLCAVSFRHWEKQVSKGPYGFGASGPQGGYGHQVTVWEKRSNQVLAQHQRGQILMVERWSEKSSGQDGYHVHMWGMLLTYDVHKIKTQVSNYRRTFE